MLYVVQCHSKALNYLYFSQFTANVCWVEQMKQIVCMLNPELYTGSSSLVLNILSLPKHSCILDNSKRNSSVEVLNTKSFEVFSLLLL